MFIIQHKNKLLKPFKKGVQSKEVNVKLFIHILYFCITELFCIVKDLSFYAHAQLRESWIVTFERMFWYALLTDFIKS